MSQATVPQNMEALAYGNAIRLEAAAIRREMGELESRTSLMRAAELLLDPPFPLRTMRLGHFLRGIRQVGTARMHTFLTFAELPLIASDRVIGPCERTVTHKPLTARQRVALADVLASVSQGSVSRRRLSEGVL